MSAPGGVARQRLVHPAAREKQLVLANLDKELYPAVRFGKGGHQLLPGR
ncbi:hypothetical protein [Actinophytocola xanthii]|nr:hypothetical protein [Actinophytocola xanthii]